MNGDDVNSLLGTRDHVVYPEAQRSKAEVRHHKEMQEYTHEGGLDVDIVELHRVFEEFVEVLKFSALAAASGIVGNTFYDAAKRAVSAFQDRKRERQDAALNETEARTVFAYGLALHNAMRPSDQLIIEALRPDEISHGSRHTRFESVGFSIEDGFWVGRYSGAMRGRGTWDVFLSNGGRMSDLYRATGLAPRSVSFTITWNVQQTLEIRIPTGSPAVVGLQFRRCRLSEHFSQIEWHRSFWGLSESDREQAKQSARRKARELFQPVFQNAPVDMPEQWSAIEPPSTWVVQNYRELLARFDGKRLDGRFRSYSPEPPPPGGVCGL